MDHYSFNRPRRDGWLSWPCWLTDSGRLTHNKVVTRPAISLAQDRESSPARTGVPSFSPLCYATNYRSSARMNTFDSDRLPTRPALPPTSQRLVPSLSPAARPVVAVPGLRGLAAGPGPRRGEGAVVSPQPRPVRRRQRPPCTVEFCRPPISRSAGSVVRTAYSVGPRSMAGFDALVHQLV